MADEGEDQGEKTVTEDSDEARHTHEGDAHADHVETGEETRAATQKWGANSPGSNQIPGTGESPSSDETENLPNKS